MPRALAPRSQLIGQPRFADPGFAINQKQMRIAVGTQLASRYEFRKLTLAADEIVANRSETPAPRNQVFTLDQWRFCCEHDFDRTLVPSWCQSHTLNTSLSRIRTLNGHSKIADFAGSLAS